MDEDCNEALRDMRERDYSEFLGRISDERRRACRTAPKTHRHHPLVRFLRYVEEGAQEGPDRTGPALADTTRAVTFISRHHEHHTWLDRKIDEVCQVEDFANAAAALAEIRALGTLLEGECPTRAVRERRDESTPDFEVTAQTTYAVEVHAKQMNAEEAQRLIAFDKAPMPPPDAEGSSWKATVISPMGGLPDETNVENVAQKFAQTKQGSKQAVAQANILWMDLHDEDVWPVRLDHANPITSCHHRFYTGGLWSAFYGWKGMPLFENHHLHAEPGARHRLQEQRFDGRFRQPSNIFDAAVYYFPGALVLLDNPWRSPVSGGLIRQFMHMLPFRFEASWVDWPVAGSLLGRLGLVEQTMNALRHLDLYESYPDTPRIAGRTH